MRLLLHGINYTPELTGIGRYTGEMGAWLAARGHRVTVLTALPYYPEWRVPEPYRHRWWLQERLDGVEVWRFPIFVPRRVTGKARLLHELSFGASCLRWWPALWRRPWDAVVAVSPLLQAGLIPALLARRQKIPFIFHIQDLQLDAARELGILPASTLLQGMARLESLLLRQATAVTTISAAMAGRLAEKGVARDRLHLLPNWADLEGIQPGARDQRLRREWGLDAEILVLYAGNLGEKQGLEVILESAGLTAARANIHYLIAGDGAVRARLVARAQERGLANLRFLPLQSPARFPALLGAADIHLVVQKRGTADLVMPSKLANILAAGRPFIATALPETELGRITRDSQAGRLVPPEDGQALAAAILQLAEDESGRTRMGQKGRRYAELNLSREAILRRLEDLLYRLTGLKPPIPPHP
jgi:colanic acid biosynthesis glycosyl transferase WcaI